MIYYSSNYLKNQTFHTLEELFSHVDSKKVALVFDTNIVVYFRDFYLNPKLFIEKYKNSEIIFAVRYLIEQISRYNLNVLASLGVDESSRSKNDFSLIKEKAIQTHNAVTSLLKLHDIDDFIKNKNPETPIKSSGEYPSSMIKFLEEESIYQHLLIVTYIISIKIIILYSELEKGNINKKRAYLELYEFMKDEIDFIPAIMQLYALHLFGGIDNFKGIIFPKKNQPENIKY